MEVKKTTVIYDDRCATCSVARSVGETLDSSGNIDFVGMNTEHGKDLIRIHGLDMEKSAYAISEDGAVVEKADMLQTVLSRTNLLGRILASCINALPRSATAKIYEFVAKHRYRGY